LFFFFLSAAAAGDFSGWSEMMEPPFLVFFSYFLGFSGSAFFFFSGLKSG